MSVSLEDSSQICAPRWLHTLRFWKDVFVVVSSLMFSHFESWLVGRLQNLDDVVSEDADAVDTDGKTNISTLELGAAGSIYNDVSC